MTLSQQSNRPSVRSYVLKLNRDATADIALFAGRLENMASGRSYEFRSGAELLARLQQDTALAVAVPGNTNMVAQDPASAE